MGSSFEGLDKEISKVKTVRNYHSQYISFLENKYKKKRKLTQPTLPCHSLSSLIHALLSLPCFPLRHLASGEITSQKKISTTTSHVSYVERVPDLHKDRSFSRDFE
jgi:hypothetical protein